MILQSNAYPESSPGQALRDRALRHGAWLQNRRVAKKAYLEVHGPVDDGPVGREPAIGYSKHKLRTHHPLDVDAIEDVLYGRENLTGELEFSQSERATSARGAEPAQKESEQLPERIKSEAAGHYRIAFEMTGEKPVVGAQIEHSAQKPFAIGSAGFRDLGNAIEHQHRWQRQLGISCAEQFASGARQKIIVAKAGAPPLLGLLYVRTRLSGRRLRDPYGR